MAPEKGLDPVFPRSFIFENCHLIVSVKAFLDHIFQVLTCVAKATFAKLLEPGYKFHLLFGGQDGLWGGGGGRGGGGL